MVGPFFRLAMLSLSRQLAFRRTVVVHLLALAAAATALVVLRGARAQASLGQYLLILGIVEGALLIGWRLTQLPKSRALEFMLVSPLRPRGVFLAEALVGLSRLALVTVAGLPVLAVLIFLDRLEWIDLGPLLLVPFTWGVITGLGLTVWAYETLRVRRWGERLILCLILLYLIVGVLAGERLKDWLDWLFLDPGNPLGTRAYVGYYLWKAFEAIHFYSPFHVMQIWFERPASRTIDDMLGLEAGALLAIGLLLWRAASRLKGHFHDRHYSPILEKQDIIPGRRILLWLARFLTSQVILWLAGGFVLLCVAYLLTAQHGPEWFDKVVLLLGTALAAVYLVRWWRWANRSGLDEQQSTGSEGLEPTASGMALPGTRGVIGNRPLAWWAVRRVTEYSGRVNLWLAGGFSVLYSAYILAGPSWPEALGRIIFLLVDGYGGIPMLTTGLVVLSAAPAALQYGLWDSNAQDRCRRLELLLLTELDARDYWEASTAAAWRRGRGYFYVALLLWGVGLVSGRMSAMEVAGALAAGVILWGLYFVLGFRAFSRGMQASGLGSLLTLGVPVVVVVLGRTGWPVLAALLPPGSIYYAGNGPLSWHWATGATVSAVAALLTARRALERCDPDLRSWYDSNHGSKGVD